MDVWSSEACSGFWDSDRVRVRPVSPKMLPATTLNTQRARIHTLTSTGAQEHTVRSNKGERCNCIARGGILCGTQFCDSSAAATPQLDATGTDLVSHISPSADAAILDTSASALYRYTIVGALVFKVIRRTNSSRMIATAKPQRGYTAFAVAQSQSLTQAAAESLGLRVDKVVHSSTDSLTYFRASVPW